MWTEEKLKEAIAQYGEQLMQEYDIPTIKYHANDYDVFSFVDVKKAFLTGAKFIINNTQKE